MRFSTVISCATGLIPVGAFKHTRAQGLADQLVKDTVFLLGELHPDWREEVSHGKKNNSCRHHCG